MIKLGNRQYTNTILIAAFGAYLFGLSLFTINAVNDPSDPHPVAQLEKSLGLIQPSELAIVTYYVSQKNTSHKVHYSRDYYGRVANLTMTNLARYSQKHGHAFFFMNSDMVDTNTRAAYWGKMDVIDHYMNMGFKWIMWTDMDVLFMDFSRSIFEEWIKPAKPSTHLLFVDECKAGKNYTGPVRSGFFAVRNSHQGRIFLQSWKHAFSRYSQRQNPDQSALEDMMKSSRWSSISQVSSHLDIHTYPKCYNGSSLSIHFPGAYKNWVDRYTEKVNLSSATSDFMIVVPGVHLKVLMFFYQKKLFDIEFANQAPWQILRNNDGFMITHDMGDSLELFDGMVNTVNISSYTINWTNDGFEDKYNTFVNQYFRNDSRCWQMGEFISDNLLNTGKRLVLTQTRLFNSKPTDRDCSSLSSYQIPEPDSSEVSVSLAQGSGFHRKFHITKRTYEEIGLLFMIPRDAFIDSFDSNILALNQYGSYKIYGDIDLEAAAYDENAKLHVLAINLKSQFMGEFDLPFHLRYQKPLEGVTYQEIKLPHPLLIVYKNSKSLFTLSPDLFNHSEFSFLSEYDDWTLSVPIGDTNDLMWMPMTTIIVVFVAILLVVTAIPRSKSKKKQ